MAEMRKWTSVSFNSWRQAKLTMTTDRHTLIPPYGYTICGVFGSCAQWIDGFGVIIRK